MDYSEWTTIQPWIMLNKPGIKLNEINSNLPAETKATAWRNSAFDFNFLDVPMYISVAEIVLKKLEVPTHFLAFSFCPTVVRVAKSIDAHVLSTRPEFGFLDVPCIPLPSLKFSGEPLICFFKSVRIFSFPSFFDSENLVLISWLNYFFLLTSFDCFNLYFKFEEVNWTISFQSGGFLLLSFTLWFQ